MPGDTTLHTIQTLLTDEQQRGALRGPEDLATREAQRATIQEQIQFLERELAQVKGQMRTLPKLPPRETIQWAQAACTLLNLVFLEIDTTGLHEDAEIIRLCVLPIIGNGVLLNVLVKPSHPLSPLITNLTGISNDQAQQWGVPIASALAQLQKVLRGQYVLSYNLDFDLGKLREAAKRAKMQEITVIGEDVMARAMRYFSLGSYPKLEDLCRRIGHPLPDYPQQTIVDRAQGQRHLLGAMSQVITGPANAPDAHSADEDTSSDDDEDEHEHPF